MAALQLNLTLPAQPAQTCLGIPEMQYNMALGKGLQEWVAGFVISYVTIGGPSVSRRKHGRCVRGCEMGSIRAAIDPMAIALYIEKCGSTSSSEKRAFETAGSSTCNRMKHTHSPFTRISNASDAVEAAQLHNSNDGWPAIIRIGLDLPNGIQ